jgi:hypothetical protein
LNRPFACGEPSRSSRRPGIDEIERTFQLPETDEPGFGQAEIAEFAQHIERFGAGAGLCGSFRILTYFSRAPYWRPLTATPSKPG